MGGFESHGLNGWRPVRPTTREVVAYADTTVFVPERAELAELFRRFGRPADLVRAVTLDQFGPTPIPRSTGPNA